MLSNLVVCYLFLGGAGAGACFVLSVLGLRCPADAVSFAVPSKSYRLFAPPSIYRKLFVPTFTAAVVFLLLGIAFLGADLARFDRLLLLVTSANFSFITAGAWTLTLSLPLALAALAAWSGMFAPRLALARALHVVLAVFSLFIMAYTGLLLSSVAAVPLWHSPLLPVLFVLSATSCGVALVVAAARFANVREFQGLLRKLLATDAALIAVELAVLAAYVLMAAGALPTEQHLLAAQQAAATPTDVARVGSILLLLFGSQAWVFWGCFIMIGLIVPLALELTALRKPHVFGGPSRQASLQLTAAACVLAGGLALRYCVVAAGLQPALTAAVALAG